MPRFAWYQLLAAADGAGGPAASRRTALDDLPLARYWAELFPDPGAGPWVQRRVAAGWAHLRDPGLVDALIQALEDGNPGTREQAAYVLRRLAAPQAAAALAELEQTQAIWRLDHGTLALVFLQLLADGQEHPLPAVLTALADRVGLTAREREVCPPGGSEPYIGRWGRAIRRQLQKVEFIQTPRRGVVQITAAGQIVLADGPLPRDVRYAPLIEQLRRRRRDSAFAQHWRDPDRAWGI